jgi:small-conductance mechanosensitive channel
LATGIVKQRFRSELYFIGAIYLFNLLGEFMPSYPFTQRIFILIISLATAIYGGYALYYWAKKPKDTTYKRWVYRLLIAYTIFSILSVYANFAGSLSLARVLARTVVINAAAGSVLVISYQIFRSLLNFFFHSRLGNQFNLIRLNGPKILRRILFYSQIFFIYVFVDNLLSLLYMKDYVVEVWENIMAIGRNFGEVYLSIGQVVDFALILFVFTIIANVFRAILEVEILPRVNVKKGVPMAVGMITRYTVLLLGFLMAVAAAGFSLSGVGFIIGAFGVGIGFGLQKIVGNFISGLILVLERPVRVGDIVTASETEGIITEIGVRASKIRDWDGAEVIIPNVDLITLKVTNWTFSDANRRREIFIRTEPDADPNKVIEIGKAVMSEHRDVIKYPEPMVLFTGFKDFYLEFRVLFWVSDNLLQATSDVSLGIWQKLNEAGIRTPIPKQEWLNKLPEKKGDEPKKTNDSDPSEI